MLLAENVLCSMDPPAAAAASPDARRPGEKIADFLTYCPYFIFQKLGPKNTLIHFAMNKSSLTPIID